MGFIKGIMGAVMYLITYPLLLLIMLFKTVTASKAEPIGMVSAAGDAVKAFSDMKQAVDDIQSAVDGVSDTENKGKFSDVKA